MPQAVFYFKIIEDLCGVKTLVSIVGTTGIGKTRLAIDLARKLDTEIVSCDSRQFFREMKIGTAAPAEEELSQARHHFIGHLSVEDAYSIGQYETDALQQLSGLFASHDQVILVGGSMMYEKAVIEGLHSLPEANPGNQEKLLKILKNDGDEKLQEMLWQLDPEYFRKVDKDNPRRLLRAIDVIWQTGRKYSDIVSEPKEPRPFGIFRIGIEAPRELIYQRINERVGQMMKKGLLQEVEQLVDFQDFVALKTVGYSELFRYLKGEWDLDFAVEEIRKNSRRFAKRQLTWYRGEENIHWVSYQNPLEESLSLLLKNDIIRKN